MLHTRRRRSARGSTSLVVATDLTANASDQGELPVLLDAVQEMFDAQLGDFRNSLADAGFTATSGTMKDLERAAALTGMWRRMADGRASQFAIAREIMENTSEDPHTVAWWQTAGDAGRNGRITNP